MASGSVYFSGFDTGLHTDGGGRRLAQIMQVFAEMNLELSLNRLKRIPFFRSVTSYIEKKYAKLPWAKPHWQ